MHVVIIGEECVQSTFFIFYSECELLLAEIRFNC